MSLALVLAAVIEAVTVALVLLMWGAAGMSDSPSGSAETASQVPWVFGCGTALAALVAASHFLPRVTW